MRYSLVNRFRGALLGAFISEQQVSGSVLLSNTVISGCKSLVHLGRLDTDNLIKFKLDPNLKEYQVQCVLAALPVALFFHENPIKLRQNLLEVVKIWGGDLILRDIVLVFGYAIALSLQERLTPSSLIPQLVAFLGETSTEIPQQLLKVQELWLQKASLEHVKGEFRRENQLSEMIAIPTVVNYALYYFISSLEDFQLSVLRSSQSKDLFPAVSIVTGVLSGAHNSISGIPVFWQAYNWQADKSSSHSSQTTENSFREIIELSDQLFAVWSGIYDFNSLTNRDRFGRFTVVSARMVKWD
jgi:hypothetical protein